MIIYIPLLYLCMEMQCGFFQSQSYSLDEQVCLQEVKDRIAEYSTKDIKVIGICVDMKIDKKDFLKSQLI